MRIRIKVPVNMSLSIQLGNLLLECVRKIQFKVTDRNVYQTTKIFYDVIQNFYLKTLFSKLYTEKYIHLKRENFLLFLIFNVYTNL